jgi:hypothetical protein
VSTVILDPVSYPPRGAYDTSQGWTVERVAEVTGITDTGANFMYKTLDDLVTAGSLPARGAGHPTVVGAYLTGYEVQSIAPHVMVVRLIYRQNVPSFNEAEQQQQASNPTLSFSASLGSTQTNKDRFGNIMRCGYEGTNQGGLVDRMVPMLVIEIEREETGCPVARIQPFMGKLNKAGWRVAPADPARSWMLVGVLGESKDRGLTYRVRYQFQFQEPRPNGVSGWDRELCFIDPVTGRPPEHTEDNLTYEYNPVMAYEQYDDVDFNLLGLA